MKTVLLDGNSLLNRAYYAIPYLTDVNGSPTNAVYGFMTMLNKIINDVNPDGIAVAFDLKAPTFRHKVCDYYKATRKPMPDDLAVQIPVLKDLLHAMNIAVVEFEGYEADDIIGTLANTSDETVIVTGDRDSLQLVSDTTTVWLTKRGITDVVVYNKARLLEDGLKPYQIIELKSLMGDSSDNIKGVTGIGEKTAKDLLEKYNDLAGVYAHIDEIKGKLKERLVEDKEQAEFSKFLATINTHVPLDKFDMTLKTPFSAEAKRFFVKLNFNSLISRYKFEDDVQDGVKVEKSETRKIEVKTLAELDNIVGKRIAVVFTDTSVNVACDTRNEYSVKIRKGGLIDDGFDIYEIADSIFKDGAHFILHDKKAVMHKLDRVIGKDCFDTYIAEYLLDANGNYEDINKLFDKYGADRSYPAASLIAIGEKQTERLKESKLDKLYTDVELPLIDLLYDMESIGVAVDFGVLNALGKSYREEIEVLKDKIYECAGTEFNINSTKQLAEVLFDRLNLPHGKKTKTGYSLAADELEKLKGKHEIISYILRYRTLAKLNGTYIEGVRDLTVDGRVHTVFKQGMTVTGRLSSTEPNLQNIPVRDKEAMILRKMFVADEGCTLISADYSQIELRLLAHFSQDKELIEAYRNGDDIHRITAAAVYGVTQLEVTDEMRSSSKAVNFGIIYGISDFGLAEQLKISPKTAHAFIEKYFATYPTVKAYMDNNVETAKRNGSIRTLFNRLRRIPELSSSNYNVRSFGERAAMNMPLQGTAADIIKIAMLKVDKALRDGGYKARIILQVHDELILNCPDNELEAVKKIVKDNMENAVKLSVPLTVDIAEGKDWYGVK